MLVSAQMVSHRLSQPLMGDVAHKEMVPKGRRVSFSTEETNNAILSASLVVMSALSKNEWAVCLTKRTSHLRTHSGQISFPGGKRDKLELLCETALREGQEEIGLDRGKIQLIGELSPIYIPVTNFLVHPFVAIAEERLSLSPNENEVSRIFWVKESDLRKNREMRIVEGSFGQKEVKAFSVKNEVVWGATAMVLAEWLHVVS